MTNALTQNIDNNKDAVLNNMLYVNNTQKQDAPKDGVFSNLVNKLSANVEKTQSNFVDKAAKSNTSSINRFNLDKNQTVEQNNENVQNITEQKPQKTNENVQINNPKDKNNSIAANNDCQKNSDLSDINDSSITEPSPVFSYNSNDFSTEVKNNAEKMPEETMQDKNQELNEIILDVFITLDIDLAQNEDLKSEIENIVQNIENADDALKAIEGTMALIDNSNLSQEQKDKLNQTFEKIKDSIKPIENKTEKAENLFADIKNVLNNFISKSENKNDAPNLKSDEKITSESKPEKTAQNKTIETKKDINEDRKTIDSNDFEEIEKNEKDLETIQKTNNSDDKKLLTEEKTINSTKEIKNVFSNKTDIKEDKIVLNENEKNQDDVKTSEIKPVKKSETLDSDKLQTVEDEKIVLQNHSEIKKEDKNENIENKIEISDDSEVLEPKIPEKNDNLVKLTNGIKEKIDNFISLKNNENPDSSEIKTDEAAQKEALAEIIKLLDEVKKSDEIDLNEKNKINEIISKTNNIQIDSEKIGENTSKIEPKKEIEIEIPYEIKQKVEKFVSVLNETSKEDDKIKLSKKSAENEPEIDLETQDNTINLENAFSNPSNNFENKNQQNQTIEADFNKNSEKISQKNNTNADEIKNKADFEIDFSKKNQKTVKIENTQNQPKETKINLDKTAFMKKIDEDILLNMEYSNSSDISGALSVADEVAKMALSETTSLNPTATVHGSINYDNLLGNNAVIKNAAQLMKNPLQNQQLENSDIFNQITNKITQLQNGSGQKLTMVLRPNNLGRLSIELTSNHLGLTTNILAQNEDVRAYIEKNIEHLRHQLTSAGVNVNNIQIKTAGQENSANYEGNQSNNSFKEENNSQKQNESNQNEQNRQNKKDIQETLIGLTNYDTHFAKDFSNVLNKSLNYNLN